jgi:hypothetical protein
LSTLYRLTDIVQGICHPLGEKGKYHPYGKGDIEQQRTETIDRVE